MTVEDVQAVPVLIAGGGPVGLATAIELAQHGVASIVVEPRAQVSWLRPRAKTTSIRTMEHFRRWGLAEAVRERSPIPRTWSDQAVFATTLLGREVTRFERCFGLDLGGGEDDLVAEGGQQTPQPVIELVMREQVAALPQVELLTGWSVRSLSQNGDSDNDGDSADGDSVRTVIENAEGEVRTIRSAYLVGADGARSLVREAIGGQLVGSADSRANFNIVFRCAPLAGLVRHGNAVHYWVLNPKQPGVLGRLDLVDTWWCIAMGVDAETGGADPVALVRELIGDDRAELPIEIIATDPWRARMQLADRYALGRVFLAGDAAHQNPPWGGHGFNTGIGDAVNLGWKLAAVLNGWAPPSLLDSYDAERRPVAAETIAVASANMAVLAPELSDLRLTGSEEDFAAARPGVASAIQQAKSGEFHSLDLVLGTAYPDSPIVVHEVPDPGQDRHPGTYRPSGAPGHRLPHAWHSPGRSLFDLLGPEFTLLGEVQSPAGRALFEAAERLGVPLAALPWPGQDAELRFGATLLLVRPDQHVAWRAAGGSTGQPIDPVDAESLLLRVSGHLR